MTLPSTPSFDCIYYPQPFLEVRIVIAICGCLLAVFSIVCNLLSIGVVASCPHLRSQYHFQRVIAVIDTIFAIFYCLNSKIIFAEYFEIPSVSELWHKYARLCITGSQIILTSSTYVALVMAMEYVLLISNRFKTLGQSMKQHRRSCLQLAIGFSILFKGTISLEIVSVHIPECEDFERNYLTSSELAYHPVYNTVWRLWIRNFATIIGPFIILLACVFFAISYEQSFSHIATTELTMTQKMRSKATYRVVLLATSCLLANIISAAIAVFELASASKPYYRQRPFYLLIVDGATLLTVFVGASRLLIYARHDRRFRQHLCAVLRLLDFRRHHNTRDRRLWTVRSSLEYNRVVRCSLAPKSVSQVSICFNRGNLVSLSDPASEVWVKKSENTQLVKEANADNESLRSEMCNLSVELPRFTTIPHSTTV